ncbi:MAG: type IV pilus assembly protein PilY1 [Gammaproteobacteria bacterium]|nr:MAG: type IV pilus assembly protein PilY1 [Gammaproteobacteria bacterium]TND06686.1 MAG: type IV pilus assembly protein PilY1 [Gammaproteobacteria bacterium]
MKTYHLNKLSSAALSATFSVLTLISAQPVAAAPGAISQAPLYLSTTVEPNIFFLTDDSGSMDWGVMTSETDGLIYLGGYAYYYTHPAAENDWYFIVPTEEYLTSSKGVAAPAAGVWRAWYSGYNKMYYNPSVTYLPWPGKDSGGTAYGPASPTAARYNPYSSSVGTTNLTATTSYDTDYGAQTSLGSFTVTNFYPARYYTWTDTNTNSVIDASDGHTLVEVKSTTPTYTGSASRTDCVGAPACTYAEEIQNFANWFTYYRKREYSAKNAVGTVITNATFARVGYATINNNGNLKTKVATMTSSTNKDTLLGKVFQTNSTGGTPLQTNLRNVGRYFECANNNIFDSTATNCPILSSADGGTCQQNYTVLMTDGFYNGSSPSLSPSNTDGDNNTPFDGGTYADSFSNTLADVAMHYYERDLRTSLADQVTTTPGVDDANHQHMVTYTVSFGVNGTLNPSTTSPGAPGFSWPDPSLGDPQKIDDLWHAAYNGRGQYLSAQNPQELNSSLNDAINNITDRTSTAAAVAFNSTSLGTDSSIYLARFNTGKWSGDLLSYALDPVSGAVAVTPTWTAAALLDARNLTTSARKILTYTGTAGIPFQWASLATAHKDDLKKNSGGGVDTDAIGQTRLNYLRGDRTNEGASAANFRLRASRLGDIVQANPVFVGKPELNYPATVPFPTATGETYAEYKTAQAARTGVVYVGANDGMLHGFDATSGAEVLAYVPNYLYSTTTTEGLHYLTDKTYSHRYHNDLSPTVADAYVKTTVAGAAVWKTVLIGGARAGARGLFALDVTNPSGFSESGSTPDDIAMWEFTNAHDTDLGYTFSKPTIALMDNGKWAAIVGNGYNDTGSGQAKLFIIYLDGGIDGVWTPTTDYVKISTGVGSIVSANCLNASSDCNGLSTPTLADTDGNGTVDRVYAGDLKGNLWVFDVSGATDSSWGVAYKTGSTPKPLFTAKNAAGTIQPITVKPVLAKHPTQPDTSNGKNIMVYFGTGQYINDADKTTTTGQSFYGVWDHGSKELLRANVVAQTFQSGFPSNVRVLTNNTIAWTGGSAKHGWLIDLPTSGERVVANPKIRGSYVFINTLIPTASACSFGGSGWLMTVNTSDGGQPSAPVFDVNNDGAVDDSGTTDKATNDGGSTYKNVSGKEFLEGIPTESNFLGDNQYTPGSSGNIDKGTVDTGVGGVGTGRLSWQELHR